MNEDEMSKNDRREIMDLLDKLERGELCTPNCYGCFGDGKLSFSYCPDVTDNFEKELANLGYCKVADDEMVIKKSEYEAVKKSKNIIQLDISEELLKEYEYEMQELRQNVRQETAREILQELNDEGYKIYKQQGSTFDAGNFNWLIAYTMRKYGIELEGDYDQRRNKNH